MDLINILENTLGSGTRFSNNEIYFYCPFCHHKNKKFAINLSKYAWHCWVCQVSGKSLFVLFKKLNRPISEINQLSTVMGEDNKYKSSLPIVSDIPQLQLPPEYIPLWTNEKFLAKNIVLQYLKSRNISFEDILRYQLGYCPDGRYAKRIILPSFSYTGELNYFVARSVYNDVYLKYLNPLVSKDVILFDLYINWNYPIVLCEGVFDAIAIRRNAIPLGGTTIMSKLKEKIIEKNVRDIYLCLDKDALRQTLKPLQYFMKQNINIYQVKLEEKDPSIIGFNKMCEYLKNIKKMNYKDLLDFKLSNI